MAREMTAAHPQPEYGLCRRLLDATLTRSLRSAVAWLLQADSRRPTLYSSCQAQARERGACTTSQPFDRRSAFGGISEPHEFEINFVVACSTLRAYGMSETTHTKCARAGKNVTNATNERNHLPLLNDSHDLVAQKAIPWQPSSLFDIGIDYAGASVAHRNLLVAREFALSRTFLHNLRRGKLLVSTHT